MKKSIKFIAVAVAALMLCLSLVSCGTKLDGEYEYSLNGITTMTLEFDGKNITSTDALNREYEGTYSIIGNAITVKVTDEDGKDAYPLDPINKSENFTFTEMNNGDIVVGGLTFEKVEK